ncbi:hypothetical protein M9H77_20503 [Catharanthus roseus]|uniref:Uncharacterized protein n=1 Tax=Catharanthus roseus TaxID=4058 RepID=A0ACC0AJY0_CATRO|nr:hypothetical protein M9H77_20503 [Catharanthus roseus]
MDLGCLDMGCIERQSKSSSSPDKESSSSSSCASIEPLMATSKIGKNKGMKEARDSCLSSLNKCTSQIRKPPHRKTSPLNWFPRIKVDSYLKRKIRLLQEVDGMNSTLDETLGDSNPHYSKVLKEKMAVREAATKAMEARKAAMVEASWCKILHAAGIDCKDAEAKLLEAEKSAADAFEAATSIGVIMYDSADCPQKHYKIETSAAKGGGSTTHAVSASFETAFEVDKQVASAVKMAFTKLANCPSINKDEFKELLRKISQNPDSQEISEEFFEFSSEYESDTGSEFEEDLSRLKQIKFQKRQASEKFNTTSLVEMMLERLKGLHEDELASLATIVATCGLNAALAEGECRKKNDSDLTPHLESGSVGGQAMKKVTETGLPSLDKFLVKRLTRLEREVLEAKNARKNEPKDGNQPKLEKSSHEKPIHVENESSGLGTILVKQASKLEKYIAEARTKNEIAFGTNSKKKLDRKVHAESEMPSLDKFLVKHMSKLEKEVQEAKNRRNFYTDEDAEIPKTKKTTCVNDKSTEETSVHSDEAPVGKENIDHNKTGDGELDVKKRAQKGDTQNLLQDNSRDHETECLTGEAISKEPEALSQEDGKIKEMSSRSNSRYQRQNTGCGGNGTIRYESLDSILVKHVSKLEKEKMKHASEEVMMMKVKRKDTEKELAKDGEASLDQILVVKHKSRLEREKMAAAAQTSEGGQMRHSITRREAREKELQETWGGLSLGNSIHAKKMAAAQPSEGGEMRHSITRREAREKEMQEAWGGLSLGNSIRPHLSRLQRDKAAWLQAEEEERRRAMEEPS